jgi:hypothetical protein
VNRVLSCGFAFLVMTGFDAEADMLMGAQAEDKEALLRKQARQARFKAARLSDKARRLRALAQKGVNNVMESTEQPSPA